MSYAADHLAWKQRVMKEQRNSYENSLNKMYEEFNPMKHPETVYPSGK